MGYLDPVRASSDIQLVLCIPSFWQLMMITPETHGQKIMVINYLVLPYVTKRLC